tara:strand:- start:7056 stop:7727 length:672 start_codon:yes stop_codon:yes gene_type:complete
MHRHVESVVNHYDRPDCLRGDRFFEYFLFKEDEGYRPNIVNLGIIPPNSGFDLDGDTGRSLCHVLSGECKIETGDGEVGREFTELVDGKSAYVAGDEALCERIHGESVIIHCGQGSNIFTRKDPQDMIHVDRNNRALVYNLHVNMPGSGDISRITVTDFKEVQEETFVARHNGNITLVRGSVFFFNDATELRQGEPYQMEAGKEYHIKAQRESLIVSLRYAKD